MFCEAEDKRAQFVPLSINSPDFALDSSLVWYRSLQCRSEGPEPKNAASSN